MHHWLDRHTFTIVIMHQIKLLMRENKQNAKK